MPRKKAPANTLQSQLDAIAAVNADLLQPPAFVRLSETALQFWPGVIMSRARAEWLDVDLVVAAQLATCQASIEAESRAIEEEGTVLTNERGTKVANPRANILEALARREMALMRTLRMGGRIAGDTRDEAGRRRNEKTARDLKTEIESEEFLA